MREVIFWDFDGTLVHSEYLWSSNVYEALKCVDKNVCRQVLHGIRRMKIIAK